jgi:putative ABC transport system permease protein
LLSVAAIWWFLRTQIGLAVRSVGANDAMATAQGVNTKAVTILGLGAASAFSAFSGAAVAQIQGYADVAMGFGILINGLAALIIGEAVIGRGTVLRQTAAPFVGSMIYYQSISLGLAAGVDPSDLKMVTALFVLATLALPAARRRIPTSEARVNA